MPVPIICLDDELCHFVERYRPLLWKPHYQSFVIVLLGLMLCEGRRTLVGLLEQVAESTSVSGLSRFLAQAPWDTQAVGQQWLKDFRARMQPTVKAEQERQRTMQPKRRGRPKQPFVTGYLIGDDSTMHKPKGKHMEGLGQHHSTTADRRLTGHSMAEGLYVLLGQRCPLVPQLYRQQAVCEQEDAPFQSKIELMEATIRSAERVAGTRTHVLLDSWYCAKVLWQAARERNLLITTGLKSNRWLRIEDASEPCGWRWQRLSDYVASLDKSAYIEYKWPRGGKRVYVHVVTTQVRKLYRCRVVIVRQQLSAPLAQTRYWASSDLEADAPTLLGHIAARWDIEVQIARWQGRIGTGSLSSHERDGPGSLLDAGYAGLCLPGRRTAALADPGVPLRHDWRGATRTPASSAAQCPALASCAVPIWRPAGRLVRLVRRLRRLYRKVQR